MDPFSFRIICVSQHASGYKFSFLMYPCLCSFYVLFVRGQEIVQLPSKTHLGPMSNSFWLSALFDPIRCDFLKD